MGRNRLKRAVIRIERGRRKLFQAIEKFNDREDLPYSFDRQKQRTIFDDDEEEEE